MSTIRSPRDARHPSAIWIASPDGVVERLEPIL